MSINCSATTAMSKSSSSAREQPQIQRPYHADQRQQVLRQQQQRLLLLRHASKCPHECGTCPVTPHCQGMKRLWKHIAECKDQQCQMAHCVSSRYVLSHYHRCKDPRCAVCGPVREAIQRNHEKAKQHAIAQHRSSVIGLPCRHAQISGMCLVAALMDKAIFKVLPSLMGVTWKVHTMDGQALDLCEEACRMKPDKEMHPQR